MLPIWVIVTILIGLPIAWAIGIATGYRLGKLEKGDLDGEGDN